MLPSYAVFIPSSNIEYLSSNVSVPSFIAFSPSLKLVEPSYISSAPSDIFPKLSGTSLKLSDNVATTSLLTSVCISVWAAVTTLLMICEAK